MKKDISRRRFLAFGAGTIAGGLLTAGTTGGSDGERATGKGARRMGQATRTTRSKGLPNEAVREWVAPESDAPVDVRGAIYMPTRAFNRYQMWKNYDEAEIERDLGYAAELNLNAVRTWLSYAYWLEDPDAHAEELEHFLQAAADNGLRVLMGLHDSVGREPTYENLIDDDPLTGVHTFSPATRTMLNEDLWTEPREYVRWFMRRYSDDPRLLAIELTNEPGWNRKDVRFMEEMASSLTTYRGDVPLTVGSTSLANNTDYLDWGMDILQFHYNFAQTTDQYQRMLRQANHVRRKMGKPVWLSEWQRIREGKAFFADVSGESAVPDYASLAPTIRRAGMGNFFWSLMVKPAYSVRLRRKGVINGLFHEDGAVWSREDARAIKAMSGDSTVDVRERQTYPEWIEHIQPGSRSVNPSGPIRPRQ